MDDLISRQAAIDALRKMQTYKMFSGDDMLLIDQAGAQTELMLLPPIQPKRGRWIIKDDTERFIAQCNCCRYIEDSRRIKNFCPNCGANMRQKGENSESN